MALLITSIVLAPSIEINTDVSTADVGSQVTINILPKDATLKYGGVVFELISSGLDYVSASSRSIGGDAGINYKSSSKETVFWCDCESPKTCTECTYKIIVKPTIDGTYNIKGTYKFGDGNEGTTNIATLTVGGTCTPNCNCASTTCIGSTCRNSCDTADCQGSKDCTTTPCTDSTWTPDASTVCSGEQFTQTSNCGRTRTIDGTNDCDGITTSTCQFYETEKDGKCNINYILIGCGIVLVIGIFIFKKK